MSDVDLTLLYESHARSCDPNDFQGQVMRNPHGKSVGPDQVAMIVEAIGKGLDIRPDDLLLDICCGNGAITDPVFALCRGGLGVDFTPYLIEVAKANFERPPDRVYLLADALEFVETIDDTKRFTKAFCYGAFQCLPESKATGVLTSLCRRFPNLQRMFIGNLPDLDRAGILFEENIPSADELKRYDTLFGIWRTEQEVAKLAAECGWRAEFSRMPSAFYGATHRFDATLVKRSPKNTVTNKLPPPICRLPEPVATRWCVFCQQSVESWVPFHLEPSDFVRRIGSIGSNIKRFQCPHCWSTDRERHLRLFVEQLHLFEPIRSGSVLHMAPEPRLSEYVLTYIPALYIKGDLFPSHESIQKIDLQKIPFSDQTFDIVICNHMLEHVDDPVAALRELRRVLKPGARIICQTPYASRLARTLEEPLLQSPDDRLYFYGQDDHLRFFGKDIEDIITKAGFLGRLVPHAEILPETDPESRGVNEKEPFFDFVRA